MIDEKPDRLCPDAGEVASGLRLIAAFEWLKGAFVLVIGLALLRYVHSDLETFAQDLVRHLHMKAESGLSRILVETADRVPDNQIQFLSLGAAAYALIRFIEAFGLWNNRAWAEWFALISCVIYLPVELYELARGISATKVCLFGINILVVIYLWWTLHRPSPKSCADNLRATSAG